MKADSKFLGAMLSLGRLQVFQASETLAALALQPQELSLKKLSPDREDPARKEDGSWRKGNGNPAMYLKFRRSLVL